MIKIYAGIAIMTLLFAAIGGAYWRYSYVLSERDRLEKELAWHTVALEDEKKLSAKKDNEQIAANDRAQKNAKENEAIYDEVNKLRACIANKSCGFVVRFKSVEAPRLSGVCADKTQPRLDENAGGFGADFQQWYFDIITGIRLNRQQIIALQEELKARSSPNYCKVL